MDLFHFDTVLLKVAAGVGLKSTLFMVTLGLIVNHDIATY